MGNLSANTTEDEVRTFFSERWGMIKKVHVAGQPTYRFAFVEFHERSAYTIAVTLGGTLLRMNAINVGPSKRRTGWWWGWVPRRLSIHRSHVSTMVQGISLGAYQSALKEEQQKYMQSMTRSAASSCFFGSGSGVLEAPTKSKPEKEEPRRRSRPRDDYDSSDSSSSRSWNRSRRQKK